MLTSDGYYLTYYKHKNQIIIGLPQTMSTLTDTCVQIVERRTDVTETDLAVLLNIVKLIFYKEARKTDD